MRFTPVFLLPSHFPHRADATSSRIFVIATPRTGTYCRHALIDRETIDAPKLPVFTGMPATYIANGLHYAQI